MQREDIVRLRHMLDAAEAAVRYLGNVARDALWMDDMRSRAIIQAVGVIGEAAARMSPDLRERHPELPWAPMIGMRNRLVHAYFDIDYVRVWDTVTHDLPPLIASVPAILSTVQDPQETESP